MGTTILEFSSLTAVPTKTKVYGIGTIATAIVAEAASVVEISDTEADTTKRYAALFIDLPGSDYQMISFDISGNAIVHEKYTTIDGTTVQPWSEWKPAVVPSGFNTVGVSNGGIVVSTNTNGDNIATVLNTAEILAAIQLLGDGPMGVTVTVVDGSAVPVGGITVDVLDSDGNRIGVWGLTNSSGIVRFGLDADDYEFTIASTPGFATHTPQSLTVDADGETLTLTVSRQSVALPYYVQSSLGKASPPPRTLADLMSHVFDAFDLQPTAIDERRARKSAVEAIQHVVTKHAWRYNSRRDRITLASPYTTGTVAVSGATVTLSGGTWPEWASNGVLVFSEDSVTDRRGWEVRERVSDTVLLLADESPDTVTGNTFTLAQSKVMIPSNCRTIYEIYNGTLDQPVRIIPHAELHRNELWNDATPADLRSVAIVSHYATGEKFLAFSPPPASETVITMDALFDPLPAERVLRYASATASVSIAASIATFTGITIPEGMGDMLLLVGSGSTAPSPRYGWGNSSQEQPLYSLRVRQRLSSTTVELYGASGITVNTKGFLLADVVDFPNHVYPAIERFTEAVMARLTKRKDMFALEAIAEEQMRYAMEQDIPTDRYGTTRDPYVRTGHIVSEDP